MNSKKISKTKLEYIDINFIKAICENPTHPFKMGLRLVYSEENVFVKTQNIMSCKTKL